MSDTSNSKRDFFVSFNQADRAWATWIAWALEEAGYSVWFQDWDFRPATRRLRVSCPDDEFYAMRPGLATRCWVADPRPRTGEQ